MKQLKQTSLLLLSLFAGVAAFGLQSQADVRDKDRARTTADILFSFEVRENPFDYVRSRLAEATRLVTELEQTTSTEKMYQQVLGVILEAQLELLNRESKLESDQSGGLAQVSEKDCYVLASLVLRRTEELVQLVGGKAETRVESGLNIHGALARQITFLERENMESGCRSLYWGSQDRPLRPKSTGPSENNDGGIERGRGGGGS